jgi:hypothetical protein
MHYGTLAALVVCVTFLVPAASTSAQITGSATLRGTVRDPNGAVVPNATVTLINERTKDERKTTSNDEGLYVFTAVTPGNYTLRVEGKGFKTVSQSAVAIETSSTRGIDVTLEIGQPSETVTVVSGATADQLQTETGARENTITAKQINNLSIVSRSAVELLRILPGVVAPDETALESIGFGSGANATANYHVNGLRGEENNVTIDGSRMMDFGANNGSAITANPDMVQEVRVQTSNYAAEHGTSAVQINATTKGGSDQFHGSLYDYSRHWRFQASDRSNNISSPIVPRPKSKYNYPGGNIGGPVFLPRFGEGGKPYWSGKGKFFFFVGYERYYQQVDEGSSRNVVPTLKQRQGDFSELLNGRPAANNLNQGQTVLVPNGCTVNGVTAGNPAPNNNLAPCADPFGQALLNLYPLPNYTDPSNRYNYVYSVLRPNNRNQFTSRFDYTISDKTKLYVRFAREYEEQGFPRGLWWDSSNYEVPGKLTSKNLGRSFVTNLTSVINPTMTNEVLFSASKLDLQYNYLDPDKVSYAALGLQKVGFGTKSGVDFNGNNAFVPVGIIDAWGGGIGGNQLTAYGYPIFSPYSSFSVTDNLSKVHNTHTLKFGAFIEQGNKNQQSNHDTDITVAQWGQNFTGNNYGDLFVGRPIEFTQASDRPEDHFRLYNYEFYAQDSWKVRPNFTLEYGLRAAYIPQNYERNGLGVLFDPSAYNPNQGVFINGDRTKPNGFKLAARGEIPKGILPNPPVAWMPRLNFAWDIGGKGDWVIRGGAGLFVNRVQGNYDYYSSGQMPNMYSATVDTPWASATGLKFGDLANVNPFTSNVGAIDIATRDVNSNDLPRIANMSLTIEKRLPGSNILTVAYVGTQARHLPQQRNLNIIPLGRLLTGTVYIPSGAGAGTTLDLSVPVNRAGLDASLLKQFRPFSPYRYVGAYQFTGTSSYHSMQVTLSHQSGKNLQYFATYTFGKALGTVATNESDGDAWADPIDTRGRSWGVLPFDRTHVFNLSYNYTFPKLARGSFENWFTRGLLNGWQMSGITTYQSGIPIRLKFTGDIVSSGQTIAWFGSDAWSTRAGASLGAITPIYLRNPQIDGGSSVGSKSFDLSALQIPTFPNTGPAQPPFYIRTPARTNFDVSFFKNFDFSESRRLQFRAGFFNIFNQAYPTLISTTGALGASDIYLTLNTVCNVRVTVNGGGQNPSTPCDPTKGFVYTQETKDNFGKIVSKHGRRIVELALKFYF